jgi:uncharacterized membrane protein YidH (DUF202 family)
MTLDLIIIIGLVLLALNAVNEYRIHRKITREEKKNRGRSTS